MKKFIISILVLLMIISPVFAVPFEPMLFGGLITAGMGGAMWALSDGDLKSENTGKLFLSIGGIFILFDLVLGLFERFVEEETFSDRFYPLNAEGEMSTVNFSLVSQSNTASLKKKDSIFNHLLFGIDGKNSYLSVQFSW